MRRIQFIEIGDEPWCPTVIRRGVLLFDTIVSLLRVYSAAELRELTMHLDGCDWDIGVVGPTWMSVRPIYLIGIPKERTADSAYL